MERLDSIEHSTDEARSAGFCNYLDVVDHQETRLLY